MGFARADLRSGSGVPPLWPTLSGAPSRNGCGPDRHAVEQTFLSAALYPVPRLPDLPTARQVWKPALRREAALPVVAGREPALIDRGVYIPNEKDRDFVSRCRRPTGLLSRRSDL